MTIQPSTKTYNIMSPNNRIEEEEEYKAAVAILKELEKQRLDDNTVAKVKTSCGKLD